jgi:hypothetical protein
MPDNIEIPLHLYQVLEEEFTSLYGSIPAEEILVVELPAGEGGEELPPRRVEAALDWRFRGGHVKDPVGLVAELLRFSGGGTAAATRAAMSEQAAGWTRDEWARHNLAKYVCGGTESGDKKRGDTELGQMVKLARAAATGESPSGLPPSPVAVEKALNLLLNDSELYSEERFSDEWLSTATRELAKQHAADHFEGKALQHFNRLLLEEAFPTYLERISNARMAAIYRRLHEQEPKALSLSGGGIRSGTFALGLLQGFARHDLLRGFDYLSTVSGGGYIGSWLTAWLHRHPAGLEGVTRDLSNSAPVSKIDPDPKPIQYLREYSNFLTPKAGLLTADTWTFIGIYLRNLLLNWIVFIPLLMAVLMIPRLVITLTLIQPVEDPKPLAASRVITDVTGGRQISPDELRQKVKGLDKIPEASWQVYEPQPLFTNFLDSGRDLYHRHLLLLAGFLLGVWALGYIGFNRPGAREVLRERSRFWRTRSDQGSFLIWCLLPLVLSAVCLTTYWAWAREVETRASDAVYFIAFGVLFTLAGWLIASLVLRRLSRPDEIDWLEFFGLLGGGLVGGLIFWALSLQQIADPVIGYGLLVKERAGDANFIWTVVHEPFAWNDWTLAWTRWTTEIYACLAVPLFLLTFLAGATIFVGWSSFSRRISDEDREWWARLGAWVLIVSLAWAVFNALVIFGPLVLLASPKLIAAAGGISGLVSVLAGKSALTPARQKAADEKGGRKGPGVDWLGTVLPILGAVFLAAFVSLLSLVTTGVTSVVALRAGVLKCEKTNDPLSPDCRTRLAPSLLEWLTNIPAAAPAGPSPNNGFAEYADYVTPLLTQPPPPPPSPGATPCTALCLTTAELAAQQEAEAKNKPDDFDRARVVHMNVLHHTSTWLVLAIALALFGVGIFLSRFINLNLFSLHAGYRNRLIRAFLGASRPPGTRRPNPFTGFDPADNLHMHELRPGLLDEGDLLNPQKLAEALLGKDEALSEQSRELSNYLRGKDRLKNVEAEPTTTASPGLVAALRTDINAALEAERLYAQTFAPKLLESPRARRVLQSVESALGTNSLDVSSMRSDYQILLNRLVLEEAYPGLLKPATFPPPPYKLLHVINTTLNLVGGDKLAWQQRKAEPFSISPLHSGCFRLGYRRSRDYGGRDFGGITIGTAAATSGAAASSNMGYYTTSPVISLLLTLFNVRLGWWLGNPGPAGDDTYTLAAPKYSFAPVLYEAFGLTDDRSQYVYLTDGGHFENLGLYEMVLRRCRVIVVADAAADEEYNFTDLANAVRKVRIDLGVPIEFPCLDICDKETADERKRPGMYWAVGRIRYSCVDRVKAGDVPFGPGDVKDPAGLLLHGNDPLSTFLKGRLDTETLTSLANYTGGSPLPDKLQTALLDRLNRLLEGPSIYDPQRFAHVELTPETQSLLARNPQREELARLNRQLLAEAYPDNIRAFVPAPDGVLIYVKPAVYGDEPRDVIEYKDSHPSFPHQTTADQFFDEPQFESYRALGSFIMDEMCGDGFNELDISQMIGRAFAAVRRHCPDAFGATGGGERPDPENDDEGFESRLHGLSDKALRKWLRWLWGAEKSARKE